MVAIGIATVPSFVRVVRSGSLQVMHTEYVLAARAAGRRPFAIGLRHVLPNVGPLIIVQASVAFAIAVLAEAALSFLGLGTPPPTPSWGRMLQESQELLFIAPRLAVPGIAIAVAVLGFNLLGDGLRDHLDPRLERPTMSALPLEPPQDAVIDVRDLGVRVDDTDLVPTCRSPSAGGSGSG